MQGRWAYALLGIGFILLVLGYSAFPSDAQPPADSKAATQEVPEGPPRGIMTFGTTTIEVGIAITPEERTQGLSGRPELPGGEGLLFIFEEPNYYGFWMPDMNFAIDIIWLDPAFNVVFIKENATPESYPSVFAPTTPAQYVLEVPAFYAANHGIKVGSHSSLSSAN